ncbi:X-domain of DnaJ-containing-domain-containing protein [Pavlovales sp. CCMP2436]|nr:X-domain of DnaJ-containing-domain-containing protein [Pavlovales sp. CCMP2436]
MGDMMEALWDVSVLDVEKTLRHACTKVLHDNSTTKPERKRRAAGLRVLAVAFEKAVPNDVKSAGMRAAMNEIMKGGGMPGGFPGASGAAAGAGADTDEEDGAPSPPAFGAAGPSSAGAGSPPPPAAQTSRVWKEADASALSVKELKAELRARGVAHDQCVEKSELVAVLVANS